MPETDAHQGEDREDEGRDKRVMLLKSRIAKDCSKAPDALAKKPGTDWPSERLQKEPNL